MLVLLAILSACGTPAPAGPPPLALPAPFTTFGEAAAGATIGKSTDEKLVLHYPQGTDPVQTALRFVHVLEAQGYRVEGPKAFGPSSMWVATKDGAEVLVAGVPKQSRTEIHLDY
jgi:hypothetical protein